MNNIIEIIPLALIKTKAKKTILTYATPKNRVSDNSCGYEVKTQWFDSIKEYDLLKSFISKQLQAEKTYRDTYDGKATIVLGHIYDDSEQLI